MDRNSVKTFFCILGLCFGSGTAGAQVVVSGFEEVEFRPKQLREVVELELKQQQSEAEALNRKIAEELKRRRAEWKNENQALKEFLKIYRKDIERSRIDISHVVKRIREEFKILKQDHAASIRSLRGNLPPLVNTKGKSNTQKPERISSVRITSYDFLRGIETPQSQVPSLSTVPRQEVSIAERERKLAKATERKTPSHGGPMPLEDEISQEPLKTHQAALEKLSSQLKSLTQKLKRDPGNMRRHLLELGNAYLESQRYLNQLQPDDRIKLIRHAARSQTRLGSYEMALWALKSALALKPDDGNTNLLISEIHQERGDAALALERARNAHHIFQKNRAFEKADQAKSRIESLALSEG